MGFAVELYFDLASEICIKELWDKLAERSISSVLPALGSRPHISLAVLKSLDVALLQKELQDFALALTPFQFKVSAVGTFPTAEGVVFLAPIVTKELLSIHEQLYKRLKTLGLRIDKYYQPGYWMPHCTVAIDLSPDRIPLAVEVCWNSSVFRQVQVIEVGLIKFRPVEEIFTFSIGNGKRI